MKHIFIHPGQFDRQYQGTCPDSPAIQASLRRHIIAYQYPRHLVPLNTIWQIYYTADASPSRLSCYCQLLSLHKLCRPLSQHVHVTSSHCLPLATACLTSHISNTALALLGKRMCNAENYMLNQPRYTQNLSPASQSHLSHTQISGSNRAAENFLYAHHESPAHIISVGVHDFRATCRTSLHLP